MECINATKINFDIVELSKEKENSMTNRVGSTRLTIVFSLLTVCTLVTRTVGVSPFTPVSEPIMKMSVEVEVIAASNPIALTLPVRARSA